MAPHGHIGTGFDADPERRKSVGATGGDRSRTPYALATVVALVLILVYRTTTNQSVGADPRATRAARPPCDAIPLTIVSSSEKAALLSSIAASYTGLGRVVEGVCGDVSIVAMSSGTAAYALVRGWDPSVDGPQPDVWTPVTSSWLQIVEQRLSRTDEPDLIPSHVGHVASAPLVIAMPRPMAEAVGWPKVQIGWRDLFELAKDPAGWGRFGHPEWGAFKLGKTNPNFSTSGLNALIGEYYAATGTSSDLTVEEISDPRVVRFVRGVESSVVHYGDISITFLENLRRTDEAGHGLTYVSAIAIEEKSVWDYNHGNPSGDPATLGDQAPPSTPLVAVYPKEGTPVNDHPYAILDAPWVDVRTRAVAEDFLRFVQTPEEQARFQAAGFRDFGGHPGEAITEANGLLPNQPKLELPAPPPAVLDAVQRSWNDIRKRARVLVVLDVSGSMAETVASSGRTKLDLAKQAALRALGEFAPDDEVGLWIFSSDLGPGGSPWQELSPVSPLGPKRDALRETIAALRPGGGTGLYATIDRATQSMSTGFDPSRINGIVVLTDGVNDYSAFDSVDPVLAHLSHQPDDRAIRVFCIGYGDDADMTTLQRISDASFAAAYDASDPATIDQVFAAVLSNF